MNTLKNKIEKWLPHIAGLLLFFILPLFVFDRNNDRSVYWAYNYYYQLFFMIVAFYVNYYFIVPRLFFSKKIYFFTAILLFVILLLFTSQYLYEVLQLDILRPVNPGMMRNLRKKNMLGIHPKLVENFFLLIIVFGFSSSLAIVQHLRKNETKQKEIEKARVDSELAFLKNQISPHFFFNSLNNIYALIALDSDKAQNAVEKLSVLMRYLIYESNIEMVVLQKDIDFTWKYIELMQLRISSKIKLNVNIDNNLPDIKIPPLLFIPFVENAFKHGISYREDSFIDITLSFQNKTIVFSCRNSIPQNLPTAKATAGGTGIVNITKRLSLIYESNYQLKQDITDSTYTVNLTIPVQTL